MPDNGFFYALAGELIIERNYYDLNNMPDNGFFYALAGELIIERNY